MSTFASLGDLGDIIFSLPSVRAFGGGVYYAMDRPNCRPLICRMPLLQRLMDFQPYIKAFLPYNGEHIDYDFSTFREGGFPYGVTLAELHARWIGAQPDFNTPWLEVKPSKDTEGKIIVSRTFRYRNQFFPWQQLVEKFGKFMLFVGLDDEYVDFCRQFGHVPQLREDDLYGLATSIAGCELFIGNQSCPGAICEGLKVRKITEVCNWVPDCIFFRPDAHYCYDGALKFSCLGRGFESPAYEPQARANLQETPPGGWRVEIAAQSAKSYDFRACKIEICRKLHHVGLSIPTDLDELIIKQSSLLLPPPQELVEIRQARALIDSVWLP